MKLSEKSVILHLGHQCCADQMILSYQRAIFSERSVQNVCLHLQEVVFPEDNKGRYETLQVYDMFQEVWISSLTQETHGQQQTQSLC